MFRIKDKEVYVRMKDDNKLSIELYELDITDEPELVSKVEIPICYQFDLNNVPDVEDKERDKLVELYKDIVRERYPLSSQLSLNLPEIVISGLEEFCKSNHCICALAFTVGCQKIEKLEVSLKKELYSYYPAIIESLSKKRKKEKEAVVV